MQEAFNPIDPYRNMAGYASQSGTRLGGVFCARIISFTRVHFLYPFMKLFHLQNQDGLVHVRQVGFNDPYEWVKPRKVFRTAGISQTFFPLHEAQQRQLKEAG
jgi:hypothetical protein